MSKVQIKARKGYAEALKPIALLLRSYLDEHPISSCGELNVELVQVDGYRGGFSYSWADDLCGFEERWPWQGELDVWLQRNIVGLLPKGVSSLLIRISKAEDLSMEEKKSQDRFIKGEGLVEFSAVMPRYKLADLILPRSVKNSLMSALAILEHSDLIYREWGFETVEPMRKAVLNFYGPPGTGKTMAAHGIAAYLGKKILLANFAEIESKYVGDSPKNLENIFHQAVKDDAVLFFDEADSFLGKRLTSISSSSDQAVNSLRSKLLQLLEEHQGIVVFCTNLVRNYDKAFESRILRSIKFDLPDDAGRRLLIRQKIPSKLPFEEGEVLGESSLAKLAEITEGMSGREIKNAVLKTLCTVAVEGRRTFRVKDFEVGFSETRREIEELKKAAGVVSREKAEKLSQQIKENLATGNYSKSKETGETTNGTTSR